MHEPIIVLGRFYLAIIFGNPGKEVGDKRVFHALKNLPSDCYVYAQPLLVHKSERREPDYVIVYKNWGVIVLEVKDWVNIKSIKRRGLEVYRTEKQRWEYETSPVDQARNAAFTLKNMLTELDELRNSSGNLDFSYAFGAALPNLPNVLINNCNHAWGEGTILGMSDLAESKITEKIQAIPNPFRVQMTEAQVNAVRAALDENNIIRDKETGEFKGILDPTQELITKEELIPVKVEPEVKENSQNSLFANFFPDPESRRQHLIDEVPNEVLDLQEKLNVRLVRGFAGTGKTDVLILRAQYLAKQYPDKKILVTTFNDPLYRERLKPELLHLKKRIDVIKFDTLCSQIFKKRHGKWNSPQNTIGIIRWMAKRYPEIDEWGAEFLDEEFTWMKEAYRTNLDDYIHKPREGRGGKTGRTLSQNQKKQIFELFQKYQTELSEQATFDWADLHDKTQKYLSEGTTPDKKYNVILIDEAQHFAPVWIEIIKYFLEPEGVLFLCDDPSQSIYRFFSWRQKGIEVTGKTRWLRVPYRNTRQIFTAAFSLLADDELAQNLLAEDKNLARPDLDNPNLRDGSKPIVKQTETVSEEKEYITNEIKRLIENGLHPKNICIMHSKKYVLDRYQEFQSAKICVENSSNQTGMEYSALFIPQVQKFFDRNSEESWEEDQSKQRLHMYMLMTRARSHLFLTYQQNLPKSLTNLKDFVEWKASGE